MSINSKTVRARLLGSVSTRYGAPMGRTSWATGSPQVGRVYCQSIRLDSGGYDRGGAYWGYGQQLYAVTDAGETFEYYTRAHSRSVALAKALDYSKTDTRARFGVAAWTPATS